MTRQSAALTPTICSALGAIHVNSPQQGLHDAGIIKISISILSAVPSTAIPMMLGPCTAFEMFEVAD
jgi:hypothetical protein